MKEYNKLLPLRQLQHRLKKQQEKNKSLSLKLKQTRLDLKQTRLDLKQTRLDLRTSKARANKEQNRKLELIEINKDLSKGYKNLIQITRNEQKRKDKKPN
jgi:hypothetical protein